MNIELERVQKNKKDILYKMVQFALYDGSQYAYNEITNDANFKYTWFDNYFTDNDRDAYFVKLDSKLAGIVLVNENLKILKQGKSIAEFLILPTYRRNHLGKKVAFMVFDKYNVDIEIEPMENNEVAYKFWKRVVEDYTNGNYEVKKNGLNDVYIIKR